MSRSRRRTPIFGNAATPRTSEAADKAMAARALRRTCKHRLRVAGPDQDALPASTGCGDPWTWTKDGKRYIAAARPEWMRK